MYTITDYTKRRAKELGLTVAVSKKKGKKLDVFKDNELIASIGDTNYKDFPTFVLEDGQEVANERRRLYRQRHRKNTLNELLALYLLWWGFLVFYAVA